MKTHTKSKLRWILITLTLLRIWLIYITPIRAYTTEVYDDVSLVNMAIGLSSGQWLGNYSEITLIKGITYPIFLAIGFLTRIPYTILFGILTAASAAVFTRAMKPVIPQERIRALLYLLIIYLPVTFDGYISQRLYRNAVTGQLILLVLAGAFGLYFSIGTDRKNTVRYSLLYGISLFFFWNLREDSIWMVALISVALILSLLRTHLRFRSEKKEMIRTASFVILPIVILLVGNLGICTVNRQVYGVALRNDRTEGAMDRVITKFIQTEYEDTDPNLDPTTCFMSKEKFAWLIDHSETMSAHRELFLTVYEARSGGTGYIPGDHIQWMFRECLIQLGLYRDAVETESFLAQIDAELEEQKALGNLKDQKGIFLSSSTRVFRPEELVSLAGTTLTETFPKIVSGEELDANPSYSSGEDLLIRKWEFLSNSQVLYAAEEPFIHTRFSLMIGKAENVWIHVRNLTAPILYGIGLISFAVLTLLQIPNIRKKNTRSFEQFLVACGTLLSAFLQLYIFTVFSEWGELPTAFYCSGTYVLFLIGLFFSGYGAVQTLQSLLRRS